MAMIGEVEVHPFFLELFDSHLLDRSFDGLSLSPSSFFRVHLLSPQKPVYLFFFSWFHPLLQDGSTFWDSAWSSWSLGPT